MVISPPQPAFLRSNAFRSARNQDVILVHAEPEPVRDLGRVVFRTHRGQPAAAILDARGVWRCPELPVLDRVLNTLFRPGETVSAADHGFGKFQLEQVAGWIQGEVRLVV